MLIDNFTVNSSNVHYTQDAIETSYAYQRTVVKLDPIVGAQAVPISENFKLKTERRAPEKLGLLLVGLGGNNGSTLTGAIIANREGVSWRTKNGIMEPNYFGSIFMAGTMRVGECQGEDVYVPMRSVLPTVHPNDFVVGGWDISSTPLDAAVERAKVFDFDLQTQLKPFLKDIKPMPSIYYPDFIAANQSDRADNVLPGSSKQEHLEKIRQDIQNFKTNNDLEKVVVLWTANTERFSDIIPGVNDTSENLLKAIASNHEEVSPSTIFAVASILEDCPYINGSPQNTFVPGCIKLAIERNVFIGGDDFKSGQTKFKSVMVDFLVQAGIKPTSIVSYNHLGNNDGKNLSAPSQFRSKEISKSNVVDDMVASNDILYSKGEHPDHVVVIKYVPNVADSKRAMDEYTSDIFMGGKNTIVTHNTCEDSLLATPLIIDLVILAELSTRIKYMTSDMDSYSTFHPVLSILSYMLKAPLVPEGTPVINALFKQKACIDNFLRACVGLPAENDLRLEYKLNPVSRRKPDEELIKECSF